MRHQPITVVPVTEVAMPAVVDLLLAQSARQQAQDAHLQERSRPQVETALAEQPQDGVSLLALDAQRKVRGYGHASVWALKETSLLRSFLTPRNGIVQNLTLPHINACVILRRHNCLANAC